MRVLILLSFLKNLYAMDCSKMGDSILEKGPTKYGYELLSNLSCANLLGPKAQLFLKKVRGHSRKKCSREVAFNEVFSYLGEPFCETEDLFCYFKKDFSGLYTLYVKNPHPPLKITNIHLGEFSPLYDLVTLETGLNEFHFFAEKEVLESSITIEAEKKTCKSLYRRPPLNPDQTPIMLCALLYEHIHFQGTSFSFFDVKNVQNFPHKIFSSLKVTPGCRVSLYEKASFQGRRVDLRRNHNDFRHLETGWPQDNIKSAKCRCEDS